MTQGSDRPGAGVNESIDLLLPHGAVVIAAIIPPDLDRERWEEVGEAICSIHPTSPWALGDWLLEAPRRHGKLKTAARISGLAVGTLSVYRWLSSRVAPEDRNPALGVGVHQVVVGLTPEAQRDWLARAAAEGLGERQLRRLIEAADE